MFTHIMDYSPSKEKKKNMEFQVNRWYWKLLPKGVNPELQRQNTACHSLSLVETS